jgi:hypothetical protein
MKTILSIRMNAKDWAIAPVVVIAQCLYISGLRLVPSREETL